MADRFDTPSIRKLQELIARSDKYVKKVGKQGAKSSMGQTSAFWQELFDQRPNYPSLDEIMQLRRSAHLSGIGEKLFDTPDELARWMEMVCRIVLADVPAEFIRSLEEPVFGAPRMATFDGITHSPQFVVNSKLAWRCRELIDAGWVSQGAALNICEIGAGYGGACFAVHQALDVNHYLICDLPQNMFVSSVFLQAALMSRQFQFIDVDVDDEISSAPEISISFTHPDGMKRIRYPVDLVLNSYSLQEMNLETVDAYLNWISSHLSDRGVFISVNSHETQGAGIKKASDYRYERFRILTLRPYTKMPIGGFFGYTVHYEVVATMKGWHGEYLARDKQLIDPLCEAMQLGIDREIVALCDRFTRDSLTYDDREFLVELTVFFYSSGRREKDASLARMNRFEAYDAMIAFLEGALRIADGEWRAALPPLMKALEAGITGLARYRANIYACAVLRKGGPNEKEPYDRCWCELETHAPYYSSDARSVIRSDDALIADARSRIYR